MDRNDIIRPAIDVFLAVALRKESVDRNFCVISLNYKEVLVALRKESVDRNSSIDNLTQGVFNRRSPQGERG